MLCLYFWKFDTSCWQTKISLHISVESNVEWSRSKNHMWKELTVSNHTGFQKLLCNKDLHTMNREVFYRFDSFGPHLILAIVFLYHRLGHDQVWIGLEHDGTDYKWLDGSAFSWSTWGTNTKNPNLPSAIEKDTRFLKSIGTTSGVVCQSDTAGKNLIQVDISISDFLFPFYTGVLGAVQKKCCSFWLPTDRIVIYMTIGTMPRRKYS